MDAPPSARTTGLARTAGLLLSLVLVSLAGYGHLLRSGEVPYSPHSDLVAEHLATKAVLHDSWTREGRIPFWRQDQFSGYGAFGNPQAQYTYPLHALFYLVPPTAAAGPTFWLHFLAAGLALFALGSALGLGLPARCGMALAAIFNFKLIVAAYAGWLPYLSTIAVFPLCFASGLWAWRRPGLGSALGVALAGALCLHGGQLQLVFYSALFFLLFLLLDAARRIRSKEALLRPIGALALGGALAVALSAYLLLPLAAESSLLSRGRTDYASLLGRHALGAEHLLTLLSPEVLGTPLDGSYARVELWEDVAYFGLVPLALAAFGIVAGRRRHAVQILAAGFALSLLLAFDTPLLRLVHTVVPGFALFRFPSRFLFLTSTFGIALAGFGVEELLGRAGPARRRWALLGIAAAVITLEGAVHARRYLEMRPAAEVFPTTTGFQRALASDPEVHRVAPITRLAMPYGWAAFLGMRLASGYDPYNYRHYLAYAALMTGETFDPETPSLWVDLERIPRLDLLSALNVKYLISPKVHSGALGDAVELVARLEDQPGFVLYQGLVRRELFVYRNLRARPRAWWADDVSPARDEAELADQMRRTSNLDRIAIVLSEGDARVPGAPSPEDAVRVEASGGDRLHVSTRAEQERFLVLSEVWHPGWRALLDGHPAALQRVNGALMGLWVPGGAHQVTATFRPLRWEAAWTASAAAALASLGLLGIVLARRLRRTV